MAKGGKEIRRRIRSVTSTQQITKAMKMVAAAKLRRAQEGVVSARPYARKLGELLRDLAGVVDVTGSAAPAGSGHRRKRLGAWYTPDDLVARDRRVRERQGPVVRDGGPIRRPPRNA